MHEQSAESGPLRLATWCKSHIQKRQDPVWWTNKTETDFFPQDCQIISLAWAPKPKETPTKIQEVSKAVEHLMLSHHAYRRSPQNSIAMTHCYTNKIILQLLLFVCVLPAQGGETLQSTIGLSCVEEENCFDRDTNCSIYDPRDCASNPEYMLISCRRTCHACGDLIIDPETHQGMTCYGKPQRLSDASSMDRFRAMNTYMHESVYKDPKYAKVRTVCFNKHEMCTIWAQQNYCETNSQFMLKRCAPACRACDFLDRKLRCAYDPEGVKQFDIYGRTVVIWIGPFAILFVNSVRT